MANKRTTPLSPHTIAAQAGGFLDAASGGLVPPIQPSTTFARGGDYAVHASGNLYGRDDNDAVKLAQGLLAQLDNAQASLLFPSGMAAIAAVIRTLKPASTIILQSGIYWGTTKWVRDYTQAHKLVLVECDLSDPAILAQACKEFAPDLVFVETPSNPWLLTVDLNHAAQHVHQCGGLLVVDNTTATPILTRPLDYGADIVVQSATKAINGHSDVLAGVLSTNAPNAEIWTKIATDRHDAGAILGAFDAWLLIRGIRTLPVRVDRMSDTAYAIATFLNDHKQVTEVYYPGLASHTGHDVARNQTRTGGYGSLMSIRVKGGKTAALAVVSRLRLFHPATSLGGIESLVEHRHTIEPDTGIPDDLLRLSIGIEDASDLIDDLNQALNG